MPFSEKNNVLFIHIPKCAGKSFEIFLGIYESYKGSPNSRSKINTILKFLLNKTRSKRAPKELLGVIDKSFSAQHLTLQEILLFNWVKSEAMKDIIKVTIIRDPFDRAVSLFNHWKNEKTGTSDLESEFYKFLQSISALREDPKHRIACHFRQQVDYLKDLDGNIEGIDILKLENIENDVSKFVNKYDLNLSVNRFPQKIETKNYINEGVSSVRNKNLVFDLFQDDYLNLDYEKNNSGRYI